MTSVAEKLNTTLEDHHINDDIRTELVQEVGAMEERLAEILAVDPLDPTSIFAAIENLKNARHNELIRAQEHAQARAAGTSIEAQINAREKHVIAMGYEGENPAIDGTNADIRKGQEAKLLSEDKALQEMHDKMEKNIQRQLDAQNEYEKSKIERRYWEDMLSGQRAYLISFGLDRGDELKS